MPDRPVPGRLEERSEPVAVDGKRLRGVIPFGVESRDLGGFTEIIEPTALRSAKLDDLVATVDHAGVPIGRYPTTLTLEERDDGLAWSVDPPKSRQDVIEAVERGDLRAGSWRMVVAKDRWDGDVRHIEQIAELRDVSVVTAPAYPAAAVEFRSNPDPAPAEEDNAMADTAETTENNIENTEERAQPEVGRLNADERIEVRERPRGLAEEFRSHGWPGQTATIDFSAFEQRAVTWGTPDSINPTRVQGVGMPYDQRYLWQVVPRTNVDAATTAVQVVQQSARSLASAANVNRALTAVTAKPETSSTIQIVTLSMRQLANVQSGVPNYLLEQPAVNTIIESDLRLALNDALDALVLAGVAASGFQAPGTDNILVSIRKAITTLQAAGYSPDLLVMTPAAAEAIDVMVSGITGGSADFVFAPGQFAPDSIFGLRRVVSKGIPASAVLDSQNFGRLYVSPVSLARFEEAAGSTNTSLIRLEMHAVWGTERQTRP